MKGEYIVLAIAGIIFIIIVASLYNTLIRKRNAIQYVLSSLDALLKKRCDLIPNLVSTVLKYMEYEKTLLDELTELRARAISPDLGLPQRTELDSKMGRLMKSIVLSAENYPQLKASSNLLHLQATLNEVEEQISAARRALSASITEYNNAVRVFPTNIMARLMGYQEYEWYRVSERERSLPDLKNLLNN